MNGVLMAVAGLLVVLVLLLIVVVVAKRMDRDAAAFPEPAGRDRRRRAILLAIAGSVATSGLVAGLVVHSARKNTDAEPPDLAAPPVERELASGDLRGLLVSPAPDAPVVLIVPGSGPTDRDGNNPLGVRAAPYRLLAEALADLGVSSVRVDKHGMYSSKASGAANDVTVDSYASDYRSWIDTVRAETGMPCIWLLGHSEGALMVSAAAIGRDDVCGLILVSGIGRKLGPVLRAQLAANPANAPLLDAANAAIDRIEAGERVESASLPMALRPLFPEAVQGYLISAFAADPVEQVRRASVPTLVVQGTTDIQIAMEDAELLAAAPGAELSVIEGMNHVLKFAPANRLANMATYLDPDLPLAPGLAETIADFVLKTP